MGAFLRDQCLRVGLEFQPFSSKKGFDIWQAANLAKEHFTIVIAYIMYKIKQKSEKVKTIIIITPREISLFCFIVSCVCVCVEG